MDAIDRKLHLLRQSTFRRRFALGRKEQSVLAERGTATMVRDHGRSLLRERLAPASPACDGKQTPMRGHPVFIAQHATATCCRGCLARWHEIPKGRALSEAELTYVLEVIERWLIVQPLDHAPPRQPTLFDP